MDVEQTKRKPRRRGTSSDKQLDKKVAQLRKQGKNDSYINSYIRGWRALDNEHKHSL